MKVGWLPIAIFATCLMGSARGVTLQEVLDRTLEKNPAIQETKAGLETSGWKKAGFSLHRPA